MEISERNCACCSKSRWWRAWGYLISIGSDSHELRLAGGSVVGSRRRTVRIVHTPSPSSRGGTADNSQTQAGSKSPVALRNANSMGLRELGRIPTRARSECGSMFWARQRTPATFHLDMQNGERGYLEIPLPRPTYLVVAVSIGIYYLRTGKI